MYFYVFTIIILSDLVYCIRIVLLRVKLPPDIIMVITAMIVYNLVKNTSTKYTRKINREITDTSENDKIQVL